MKKFFKRIIGYWMLIEAIVGIVIFLFEEKFRQQLIPALFTIALFFFLAYLCLKKSKPNNEAHAGPNAALNQHAFNDKTVRYKDELSSN